MSRSTRQEPFLLLMQSFLDRQMKSQNFCAKFTRLWIQNRDSQERAYAKKKADWPEPYDEVLVASFQRGEISGSEFRQASADLWGYADILEFQETIDAIHSACSVFAPEPEMEWEISEEQLRQEVAEAFAKLQEPTKPLTQAI